MSSASEGEAPLIDPLTRGFAPGPHWGAKPPEPHIRSRYRARHEAPKVLFSHCYTLQIAPWSYLTQPKASVEVPSLQNVHLIWNNNYWRLDIQHINSINTK